MQVIRNKLHNNDTLVEQYVLRVEAIMEVLEVCLKSTYFKWVTSSSNEKLAWLCEALISPIISNIFTEHSEKSALDSALHKALLLLQYVYDTIVVWPQDPERFQKFLSYLNILRPSM
jgi:hypothetical protein